MQQIKSYANILSRGLTKMTTVFKGGQIKSSSDKDIKKSASLAVENAKATAEPISQDISDTIQMKREDSPIIDLHSEIPGLIFKTNIERRPSKKKHSKPPVSEDHFEDITLIDTESSVVK